MIPQGRKWITESYLPNLRGSVLLVGVNEATKNYHNLVANPEKCVTVDTNIKMAIYGSPNFHIVSDLLRLDVSTKFDHIFLYGLDTKYTPRDKDWISWSEELLCRADVLLKKNGTILFGGSMGEGWESLRKLPMIAKYNELFFNKFEINEVACVKWWIIKNA